MENNTGFKIRAIRSDNETEYCKARVKKILSPSGTKHQTTVPYTPEQNGMAQRMNRTLAEKARSLFNDSDLEKKFWTEAINTGVKDGTPEGIWSGLKPNLKHLRVFG